MIPTINSPLVDDATKRAKEAISKAVASGTITSKEELRNAIYSTFLDHFDLLANPRFEAIKYGQYSWKDPSVINANINICENIFNTLVKEISDSIEITLSQEVLLANVSLDVVTSIESAASMLNSIEDQIRQRQFFSKSKAAISFSDDFVNMSKVNFNDVKTPVRIVPGFGAELPGKSELNLAGRVKNIVVTPSTGSGANTALHPEDLLPQNPRPYHGKRFDYPRNARPEGNAWRISSANTKVDVTNAEIKKGNLYTNLSKDIWPENQPILVQGSGTPGAASTTNVTTYTITKTTPAGATTTLTTTASSVTRKPGSMDATNFEVDGWVSGDGSTVSVDRTVNSTTNLPVDPNTYRANPQVTQVSDTGAGTPGAWDKDPNISSKSIIQKSERFDDRTETGTLDGSPYVTMYKGEAGVDAYANTFTRSDFVYYEAPAGQDLILQQQMRMFDGKIDTFYEIEYTPYRAGLGGTTVALGSGTEAAINGYTTTATSVEATLAGGGGDSLTITLLIEFDNSYVMNYITLDPFFFGDVRTSGLTVTDIQTRAKSTDAFVQIPGFATEFTNTLNITANSQISMQQAVRIDATNSSKFIGKGFWTLPAGTQVQAITMTIRQDKAVANPYPLHNVQLLRKVSKTISESKSKSEQGGSGFKSGSTSVSGSGQVLERGRFTQWIQFGYLETVINTLASGSTSSMLSGSTSGDTISTSSSTGSDTASREDTGGMFRSLGTQIGGTFGTATAMGISNSGGIPTEQATSRVAGAFVAIAATALGGIIGGMFDKNESSASGSSASVSSQFNDGGYQVNKEWDSIKWSRCRYAIGIREIGFHVKTFDVIGELLTVPYEVINGNKEVTLSANCHVPVEMTSAYPGTSFIEYYLLVENKKYPIQPISGLGSQISANGVIPTSYILSKLSPNEKTTIQLYVVLRRPTDTGILANADTMTPRLRKYTITVADL